MFLNPFQLKNLKKNYNRKIHSIPIPKKVDKSVVHLPMNVKLLFSKLVKP